MDIRIASLNCLNYGRGSKTKDKSLIAKIILHERIDIIALQEIRHPSVVQELANELDHRSVFSWKWFCDPNVPNQEYAFIWNGNKLDYPRTKLPNGEVRVYYPHIYKQYGKDPDLGRIELARPPLYGRFQTIIPGLPSIELRLINAHIRYSKGNDAKELAPTASEIWLRKNEFWMLTNNIYYRLSTKTYGKREGEGDPRTAYTILLGDFNLNLRESNAGAPYLDGEFKGYNLESYMIPQERTKTVNGQQKIRTLQPKKTTLKKPDESEEQQTEVEVFANNYDHFTLDDNRFSGGTRYRCERVNTVEQYCDNDVKVHMEKISDHVPIKITLSIKKG